MIPVFRPCYGNEELEAVREVFQAGWIGLGLKTREFEERFAAFLGVPRAVAVNSATAALHLALKVAGVEGGEVITTPMTFVSTNHAILYSNGIPVFADIEPDTLNIDPEDVRRKVTPRTRAIVVVHYGGHACDMDALLAIAREYGLKVIEDAADRNPLMAHLNERGVSTGMHYFPNHLYEMYRPYVRSPLPVAEAVWERLITLPLFPDLSDGQQDVIVEAILEYRAARSGAGGGDQAYATRAITGLAHLPVR